MMLELRRSAACCNKWKYLPHDNDALSRGDPGEVLVMWCVTQALLKYCQGPDWCLDVACLM